MLVLVFWVVVFSLCEGEDVVREVKLFDFFFFIRKVKSLDLYVFSLK